jgi:hypothetical protein
MPSRDSSVVDAYRRPLGYVQLTLTGTAQKLTLPTLPKDTYIGLVIFQMEGSTLSGRWRDDGVAPTATVGMILSTGDDLFPYTGQFDAIQFISTSGSPILNASYYE